MPTTTPLPTATPSPTPIPTPEQNTAVFSSVRDSSGPSIIIAERFLLVNQDEQMMYVYEDGVIVRSIPVSTGRPVTNAFTPAWRGPVGEDWGSGTFLDTQLWSDYMWYLFPGPEGSILIHSVPYTRDGDQKIYDRLDALGLEPTSRGCVRISPEDAAWLKQWDPVDVPIQITPWSGKITLPTEPG
jgi:lipoprotein-anchoring transpeptidase ErfK/SrfK